MDKVLITIYVLSLDQKFDLLVPIRKKVSEVLDSIQDSLVDLSNGNYVKKSSVLLYYSNGMIINPNNVVKYSGLKNGCTVCLI